MNTFNTEKIKRFVRDEAMMASVFGIIQESFLKPRTEKDVYYLAAKSLAIEFLEDARRDLNRYKEEEEKKSNEIKQIGL